MAWRKGRAAVLVFVFGEGAGCIIELWIPVVRKNEDSLYRGAFG
jgi:hypothetical protein